MRKFKLILAGVALMLVSSGSMAGGGCLAGTYHYYEDGELVGEQTVGCNPNSGWGMQTADAVFTAGCGVSS